MNTSVRNLAALTLIAGAALLLAACGTSTPESKSPSVAAAPQSASAPASAPATVGPTLTIAGFAFSPLTVKAGDTVTVANSDTADHTVTIADAGIDVKVSAGGTSTFTAPSTAGDYTLTCDFHPSMKGTLTVTS